ncbi:MAG: hypothetical protein HKM98_00890, partial [Gammaproteobacteria bacterium]|nr:hypothetical protein [Gammaproteobacteria bacterium]
MIFALLLHGCATLDREDLKASITSEAGQAKALIGPDWPQSNPRLTTSGDLYMRNLDTQIQSLQELNSIKGNDSLLPRLAGLLYHRFQINGRLPDAEQARSLLATAHGRDHGVEVDLLYAEVLMGFHEFSMAADVLASANAANTRELAALQSRIRLATGQQTDPPDLQDRSPTGLANRANVLFDQGQMLAASRLLREAQERYRNTAPYLLSWIHLQQGIFFLRSGDYESARQFFSAARGRLPQYATAVEHLAETEFALGNNRIAAELYRSVAQQTDNPEFYYQLSRVERAEGNLPAV